MFLFQSISCLVRQRTVDNRWSCDVEPSHHSAFSAQGRRPPVPVPSVQLLDPCISQDLTRTTGTPSYVYRRENKEMVIQLTGEQRGNPEISNSRGGGLCPGPGSPDESWDLWVRVVGAWVREEVNHCWTAHPSRVERRNTQPLPLLLLFISHQHLTRAKPVRKPADSGAQGTQPALCTE